LIGGSGIFGFALRFYSFDVYSFGSVKELGVEGLLLIVVIPKNVRVSSIFARDRKGTFRRTACEKSEDSGTNLNDVNVCFLP